MGTVNTELDTERHCSYLPKKKKKKPGQEVCHLRDNKTCDRHRKSSVRV